MAPRRWPVLSMFHVKPRPAEGLCCALAQMAAGREPDVSSATFPTSGTGMSPTARNSSPSARRRRWLDLGSGAGLSGPGHRILLADRPGAAVHLVESNSRKCAFLRRAIAETGAPAVVHDGRIESFTDGCGALRSRRSQRAPWRSLSLLLGILATAYRGRGDGRSSRRGAIFSGKSPKPLNLGTSIW